MEEEQIVVPVVTVDVEVDLLAHEGEACVSEVRYLDELSCLIGQYSYINVSRSHSKHGSASFRQESRDEILPTVGVTHLRKQVGQP